MMETYVWDADRRRRTSAAEVATKRTGRTTIFVATNERCRDKNNPRTPLTGPFAEVPGVPEAGLGNISGIEPLLKIQNGTVTISR
jgi:hypothetical protein